MAIERFLVEGEREEISAPGAFPGRGVPEDQPRRHPYVRQEREVDAGPRSCGYLIDEQGQDTIIGTHDDRMYDVLLQSTRPGFAVFKAMEPFPFEDSHNEAGLPAIVSFTDEH
jgi:hypothetical protein